jgi:hypothetical protein
MFFFLLSFSHFLAQNEWSRSSENNEERVEVYRSNIRFALLIIIANLSLAMIYRYFSLGLF